MEREQSIAIRMLREEGISLTSFIPSIGLAQARMQKISARIPKTSGNVLDNVEGTLTRSLLY